MDLPKSPPLSPPERDPILDAEIRRYVAAGFEVVSEQRWDAELQRPKHFAWRGAVLAFLILGVGVFFYPIYYRFLKRPDRIWLHVTDTQQLRARGKSRFRGTGFRVAFNILFGLAALMVAYLEALVILLFLQPSVGPYAGWGVHVCSSSDAVVHQAACRRSTAVLSVVNLNSAYLNATGSNGDKFSSTSLAIIFSKVNSDGTGTELGRTSVATLLSFNTILNGLGQVMDSAGVSRDPGRYLVEVDEMSGSIETSLGTARFTIRQ